MSSEFTTSSINIWSQAEPSGIGYGIGYSWPASSLQLGYIDSTGAFASYAAKAYGSTISLSHLSTTYAEIKQISANNLVVSTINTLNTISVPHIAVSTINIQDKISVPQIIVSSINAISITTIDNITLSTLSYRTSDGSHYDQFVSTPYTSASNNSTIMIMTERGPISNYRRYYTFKRSAAGGADLDIPISTINVAISTFTLGNGANDTGPLNSTILNLYPSAVMRVTFNVLTAYDAFQTYVVTQPNNVSSNVLGMKTGTLGSNKENYAQMIGSYFLSRNIHYNHSTSQIQFFMRTTTGTLNFIENSTSNTLVELLHTSEQLDSV